MNSIAGRCCTVLLLLVVRSAAAPVISGRVTDPQGRVVAGAIITVVVAAGLAGAQQATSNDRGEFTLSLPAPGRYRLTADAAGFTPATRNLIVAADAPSSADVRLARVSEQRQSVRVVADVRDTTLFNPDPAQRVIIRQETLDANPGRPGMPISIPGMPVESPAGGIKPPQYFVPGVSGDHGEPIAQFFQIGGYLFPNNLPANAHGNGYADPNILIPIAIESVQTDGGAFNVRQGNNSVNAAMVFGLRNRLEPMFRLTGDHRDANLVAGWSPARPETKAWVGLELSYGNGFLKRLEHRKQYKINASRVFNLARHDLTLYGVGYYGFSYLPGLTPIDVRVPNDTIDSRQREEASSGLAVINDVWRLSTGSELQFSGFFRTYNLDVRPNFGAGLIRQSEIRSANGESGAYTTRLTRSLSLLAGFEHRRDAPRQLNLDRAIGETALFEPVTSNDLTLNFYSPYASLDGSLSRFVRYDLGFRRDEVSFDNRDRMLPGQSFSVQQGVSSPKGTISILPPDASRLPVLSLSYGQAFHINDPRIGTTAVHDATVISKARSYQLVARKTVARTDLRLTLAHATVGQQLARISNDTGLQQDVGPALIRSMTLSARRYFSRGSVQASFSRADARDRMTGEPTPEAPRLIWDALGTIDRLPFHLQARGEFAYLGRKPLGDGFDAVPVKEFRGAIFRFFESMGMDVGVNFLLARGYGGQTPETLALPGEGDPFERITGFRLKSYVTASWTYRFGRRGR